ITSTSHDGSGSINLEFVSERDIEGAANDVRDEVSRVVAKLPRDADPPVITKADPDAQPIISGHLISKTRSRMDLTDYAVRYIQPRLGALDGVASTGLAGARQKS